MNALVLLTAGLFCCPWTQTVRYRYCEPTVIYMPCTPTYVRCEPAPVTAPVAQVVAETKKEEIVAENVAAVEEEDSLENVAAEEELVTEPAGFTYPSALTLGHMALDWGVATIGAGTLMPTTGILGVGGLGFPGNGANGSGGGGFVNDDFNPYVPPINNQVTVINNNCNHPAEPAPVPEPATILIWLVGAVYLLHYYRRHPKPVPVPITKLTPKQP